MKREMKRVAGLPLPLYLALLGLLFFALWRGVIPAGCFYSWCSVRA